MTDARILAAMRELNILVIGDLMLDHYIWGEVHRISPEAPVPIVNASSVTSPRSVSRCDWRELSVKTWREKGCSVCWVGWGLTPLIVTLAPIGLPSSRPASWPAPSNSVASITKLPSPYTRWNAPPVCWPASSPAMRSSFLTTGRESLPSRFSMHC